jgi:guanine deaminase
VECHRGHVFHVSGAPALPDATASLAHYPDGAIVVDDDGRIAWCGPWADRPHPDAHVVDHHGAFLLPGFVDTHLHFPQVYCTDAYGGGTLLHWLEHVIFPAEARLADPDHAVRAAVDFCERLVSVGTTSSLVFGSEFPHAQDALFGAARERGLRLVSGRTTMTTGPHASAELLTSEVDAVRLAREEIDRWHPAPGSAEASHRRVAIVPRFALSVTPTTLRALGELNEQVRDDGVHLTTHLSEHGSAHAGEIGAVRSSYDVASYLDVYDGRFLPGSRHGGPSLLGRRTLVAHAVHCSEAELDRLAQTGTSIAHCPVSQQFLGSGTMPWRRVASAGTLLGIGSDIGAGDEWFVPRVLNAAFKSHMNAAPQQRAALEPAQLLHLGTLGGATALDMQDDIGNFDSGKAADFVVLDPGRCPPLELALTRRDQDEDPQSLLFTLLLASDERAVASTWVDGARLTPGARDG